MRTDISLIDTVTSVHTMIPGEGTHREFISVGISTDSGPRGLTLKMSRAEALALLYSLRAGMFGGDVMSRMQRPEHYR